MDCKFMDPGLLDWLEAADDTALNALPFGVVAMSEDGVVTSYNLAESRLSGLTPAKVDAVLIALVQTCRKSLRPMHMVMRWGGEEFLIVLPEHRRG